MSIDYLKMTANTLATLPPAKQAEVYDFATYLKVRTSSITRKHVKKDSVLDLVGIGESGKNDIALNHDKYLYE
jgi:hypothetical protein